MRISDDLIDMADKYNIFLNDMIARDETWYCLYDSQAQLDLLDEHHHHHHHHHLETKKNSGR